MSFVTVQRSIYLHRTNLLIYNTEQVDFSSIMGKSNICIFKYPETVDLDVACVCIYKRICLYFVG